MCADYIQTITTAISTHAELNKSETLSTGIAHTRAPTVNKFTVNVTKLVTLPDVGTATPEEWSCSPAHQPRT